MRFSIIVPVYNVRPYLAACMVTLLEQDYEGTYEILLVDDGSTDGSEMLCDGYAAAFPEKVATIHRKNGGLGAARNTGLEAARGEYLLFVDSDDYLERSSLRRLDEALSRTGAEMLVFGFTYLWEDHSLPGEAPAMAGQPPFTLAEHPEFLMQTPSACLRVWHRGLFADPELRFPGRVWFEDLRTTPKALCSGCTVAVIPDRLYFYRQRQGSILHNPNLRRNLEIIEAMEDLYGYFAAHGGLERFGGWLGCLAAENMILAAQRVLMQEPDSAILPEFTAYLSRRFPDCGASPEFSTMGRKKKLVLALLQKRKYRLLRRIFLLKKRMRGEN